MTQKNSLVVADASAKPDVTVLLRDCAQPNANAETIFVLSDIK
jgi:hypothetical protein